MDKMGYKSSIIGTATKWKTHNNNTLMSTAVRQMNKMKTQFSRKKTLKKGKFTTTYCRTCLSKQQQFTYILDEKNFIEKLLGCRDGKTTETRGRS